MLSVDKDTNILDDKKQTVATTSLSEKKSLTIEKVTTIDAMQKRTERIEVVKCTDEVHKRTHNITKNEEVDKGTEKLEDMKEAEFKIRRNNSYKFEGQSKGSTGWFNLDHNYF